MLYFEKRFGKKFRIIDDCENFAYGRNYRKAEKIGTRTTLHKIRKTRKESCYMNDFLQIIRSKNGFELCVKREDSAMILVSQNKEKVLWFGRAFNALEYNEDVCRKGKKKRLDTRSAFQMAVWKRLLNTRVRNGVWKFYKIFVKRMQKNAIPLRYMIMLRMRQNRQHVKIISCITFQKSRMCV